MDIKEFSEYREKLDGQMADSGPFSREFGQLDGNVYAESEILKKYKWFRGLSFSIVARCNESIMYHVQGCLEAKADKKEIIEAIKIGAIGGGPLHSLMTDAFSVMNESRIINKHCLKPAPESIPVGAII